MHKHSCSSSAIAAVVQIHVLLFDLCKRFTVISETRPSAPNVFCIFGLCKALACDKLAGYAYGAVIAKGGGGRGKLALSCMQGLHIY